ncbi:MAG TPA: hypothetical protein VIY68_07000 [Steroidobacteraceae bacterium]
MGAADAAGGGQRVGRQHFVHRTDLNDEGQGGVPALFKSFTSQAGLSYDVYLETHPGVGIDWGMPEFEPCTPVSRMPIPTMASMPAKSIRGHMTANTPAPTAIT